MSHSSRKYLFDLSSAHRSGMLLAAVILIGCAVAAGAVVLSQRREPEGKREMGAMVSTAAAKLSSAPSTRSASIPSPTPQPDPNFVRVAPLKLPGITSPEAERVLLDLQGAYRCLHTGNKRALAAWLPAATGDAPTNLEDFSTSMQQSLAKLPDACYVTTALPQVVNPRTPAALMDMLCEDLARRPDPIKLRTLFLIAGTEGHPRAPEALANLQALLNTDYQRDWSRWDQAISEQLAHETHGMRGVSCRMH